MSQIAPPAHRYVPQSPKPDSPPPTPSPSSPNKPHQALTSVPAEPIFTHTLDTPATTPDKSSTPVDQGALPTRRSSSISGMGIVFPPESNPLPEALGGEGEALNSSDMARSMTDPKISPKPAAQPMAPSRSTGAGPARTLQQPSSYAELHPHQSRPRSLSPTPGRSQESFALSSSISHAGPPGSEYRERIVSPTRPNGLKHDQGSNEQLPALNVQVGSTMNALLDEKGQAWSPAMDGKKEPSIKNYLYEPYDPTAYASPHSNTTARSRSPYVADPYGKIEYDNHPLTGQAYNHPTRDIRAPGGGFYDSTAYWLGLYFFCNLGLTLFNKIVLVSFPFPYTLTGLHALSGCAGCYFALERGAFIPARLTQRENIVLAAFSVLYTINIAVSNISLQLVSIPFHQVVRASTPLFTIVISAIVLRTRASGMKFVSLLPVVAGVGFATYGDYDFTAMGFILTMLGTFLAALKTVVTNLIQTGGGQRLKLHPLDLLMRMSPLAFIQCVVYGWYTGELERVRRYGATQMTRSKAIALLVNGVIACGLNIVSFTANKKAGPLTMTVSANCKQVLTIALAVFLFGNHISPMNGLGILLTLVGGGWYGYVEYTERTRKSVKLVDRS